MANATAPCNGLAAERIARARDLGFPILFHCGYGPVDSRGRPYVCSIECDGDLIGVRVDGGADRLGDVVAAKLHDAEEAEAWAEHAEEVERDRCASY